MAREMIKAVQDENTNLTEYKRIQRQNRAKVLLDLTRLSV